jgi:endonuclease III
MSGSAPKPGKIPGRIDPRFQAKRVVPALVALYPEPRCALVHDGPFQLLVATVLSAQCTDARVNLVTPALFARFPDARRLALAETEELEDLIRPAGFFRAKAKSLKGMAHRVVAEHGGEIPGDLDALTAFPGVGRKTAHVVLGNAFDVASGVVVDTHVKRLCFRLGLTESVDPVVIERELNVLIPKRHWVDFSHRLIDHGRKVCDARKPRCSACALASICPRMGVTVSA